MALAATTAARGADDEVVVISPHWSGIRDETTRAFDRWHRQHYGTPAVVRWRDTTGGGSQIVKFILGEFATEPSAGIDVLYGAGVDPYRDLAARGLLTVYNPNEETLAHIPATLNGLELIDPAHRWFAASIAGFGIITNERARAAADLPEVRQWSDLTNPQLEGWISGCDPRASSSALAIYEIILQAYGWDRGWAVLMQMSGNIRNYLSSAAASAVEVGMGDAAYGISIDSYGQAQSAYYGPDNVSFTLPQGETVMSPDAIAILKNPPHLQLAQHFLEFVLSREGQLLWMARKGAPGGATRYIINRMGVRPALYGELAAATPVQSNPFTMPAARPYSNSLGSRRRNILGALISTWMIDTHDPLTRAWKALQAPGTSPNRPAKLAAFLTPPCSESELLRLGDTDWKDPVKRAELTNAWQAQALNLYRAVSEAN